MKLRLLAASLAAITLVSAAASAQDTTSEKGKLSYAIGFNTGVELAELTARGEAVDVNTVIKAIQDAYAKKQPAVPVTSAVSALSLRLVVGESLSRLCALAGREPRAHGGMRA